MAAPIGSGAGAGRGQVLAGALVATSLSALALLVALRALRPHEKRRAGSRRPVVKRLFLFPLKSCAPVEVQSLKLTPLGFEDDRRWAVLSTKKDVAEALTLRTHPRLALIQPAVERAEGPAGRPVKTLALTAPGMPPLRVPVPGAHARPVVVDIHDIEGTALDCGEEAARWLEAFFQQSPLCLAFLGPPEEDLPGGGCCSAVRLREPCKQLAWNNGREEESVYYPGSRVAFVENTQGSVVSEASLADVNARLRRKHGGAWGLRPNPALPRITPERFRMNVVLEGVDAYEEESWKRFCLEGRSGAGSAEFEVGRLCFRCAVTLVDPATGERGPKGMQPLELLREYRRPDQLWRVDERHKDNPILGTKFGWAPETAAEIKVGDEFVGIELRTEQDRKY